MGVEDPPQGWRKMEAATEQICALMAIGHDAGPQRKLLYAFWSAAREKI
ncbi:MAG: hypothetical protein AB7U61_10450 [Methylocystis sp.]